jgi:hypothetical protein
MELACARAEMPNRIEALDYVRTPVRPPMCAFPPKSAFRRQGAQIKEQILFQVEDRILPKSSPYLPHDPVPHPQRIAREELVKILRDNETVFADVVIVSGFCE